MMKELWTGKKKLVIKIVAGVVTVAVVGTGIGFGAVQAKSQSKDTTVGSNTTEETEDAKEDTEEDDADDQAALLTNIIKSQVGSDSTDAGKEENVYVISDASGVSKEVIVSDWLKNPEAEDTLTDASNLTDIKNVKGDETFKQDKDGTITWQADGSDIYYQGTTDAQLPVDVKITYYLDGKEMKPEDMAGKSGKVKIRFDYENKQTEKVKVGNKEEEVYVPFTVMSAMMLPTDTFSDITVTNGKVMSEGLNNIVMGLAFPGLQDSLQIDEKKLEDKDIEIPSYVEVNAITSDFALDMTLSVVLSDALSDIHLTDSIDLSDLDDKMDKLTDASGELQDGTKKLKDGVDTLNEKTTEFQDGAKKLNDGIVEYTNGVATLSDGIGTLKSGAQSAADGASKLADGASQVSQGVNTLTDSLGTLGSTLGQNIAAQTAAQADAQAKVNADEEAIQNAVTSYTTSVAQAAAGAAAYCLQHEIDPKSSDGQQAIMQAVMENASSDGISAAVASLGADAGNLGGATGALTVLNSIGSQLDTSKLAELKAGAASVASGASELNSGIGQINSGADQLKSGADTLTANSPTLVDGAAKLYDGTNQLADGVTKLETGATDLNDGMVKFDKDGIKKLTDALQGDGKNILDRLNATMDAGHDYHTFTELPDGVDGSVKFIIRTEAIK